MAEDERRLRAANDVDTVDIIRGGVKSRVQFLDLRIDDIYEQNGKKFHVDSITCLENGDLQLESSLVDETANIPIIQFSNTNSLRASISHNWLPTLSIDVEKQIANAVNTALDKQFDDEILKTFMEVACGT